MTNEDLIEEVGIFPNGLSGADAERYARLLLAKLTEALTFESGHNAQLSQMVTDAHAKYVKDTDILFLARKAAEQEAAAARANSDFLTAYLAEHDGPLKIGRMSHLPEGARVQLYKMESPSGFMAELVDSDGELLGRKGDDAGATS